MRLSYEESEESEDGYRRPLMFRTIDTVYDVDPEDWRDPLMFRAIDKIYDDVLGIGD